MGLIPHSLDNHKKMEKQRNQEYERKFRAYLFSFDWETHKQICGNLNVKPKIGK